MVNRGNFDRMSSDVKHRLKSVEFSRTVVVLIQNGVDGSIAVNVDEHQISTDHEAAQREAGASVERFERMGKIDDRNVLVQRVGSSTAVVIEFEIRGKVRILQVMIPGGGKTYTATCTAEPDTFHTLRPVFEKVLASIQSAGPSPSRTAGRRESRIRDRTSRDESIAGAILIGMLIWAVRKVFWKSRPK